jgi:hypothetical protein
VNPVSLVVTGSTPSRRQGADRFADGARLPRIEVEVPSNEAHEGVGVREDQPLLLVPAPSGGTPIRSARNRGSLLPCGPDGWCRAWPSAEPVLEEVDVRLVAQLLQGLHVPLPRGVHLALIALVANVASTYPFSISEQAQERPRSFIVSEYRVGVLVRVRLDLDDGERSPRSQSMKYGSAAPVSSSGSGQRDSA